MLSKKQKRYHSFDVKCAYIVYHLFDDKRKGMIFSYSFKLHRFLKMGVYVYIYTVSKTMEKETF